MKLGRAYAELVTRPEMVALMRTVIAESPRFPELRERTFDFGTLPVLTALGRFLRDRETASAQFHGMIASSVFWPRPMHGTWPITDEAQALVVEAVWLRP